MIDSHEALGIAQIVFYAPVVPIVIYLMIRNGKIRPRMAWYPLIPFSLMRLAGGPVIIALEHNPESIGLLVAALILLNVGVIPLIISTLGLVRIIKVDNYHENHKSKKILGVLRFAFLVAVGLLAGGGGVSSIGTPSSRDISRTLTLVGYVVFAVILMALIGMQLFFWKRRWTLLPSSQTILRGSLLASPFLIIRTVFGILEAALQDTTRSPFDPVTGSAIAFGLMALLPEYIALAIYIYSGFSIAPDRGVTAGNGQTVQELSEGADKTNV